MPHSEPPTARPDPPGDVEAVPRLPRRADAGAAQRAGGRAPGPGPQPGPPVRGRGEPLDDLEQVAFEGLVKAVERFDPDRGPGFAAFAVPTIVGEIKRHFRDHTWATKVPRAAKELATRLTAATEALSVQLHRAPTVPELADALGVSEDVVIEALDARTAYRPASLSTPADRDGGRTLGDTLATDDRGFARVEAHITVEGLLASLPERERRILELRYFDELSQDQIAARVGISQMHVSRLLRRVTDLLAASAPADGEGGRS